jgi:hypothetical protein
MVGDPRDTDDMIEKMAEWTLETGQVSKGALVVVGRDDCWPSGRCSRQHQDGASQKALIGSFRLRRACSRSEAQGENS